jgi:CheY-like chemotaxis protein
MKFHSGQLSSALKRIEQGKFTGTVTLTPDTMTGEPGAKVLAFWDGGITFVGDTLPSPLEFVEFLKRKLKLNFLDSSIKIAEKRLTNKGSVRELLNFINGFGMMRWDSIESVIQQELIVSLEPVLDSAGELKLLTDSNFDLSYGNDLHGFSWASLQEKLIKRQTLWQSLLPLTLDSIPVQAEASASTAIPQEVLEHLKTWVDGTQSVAKIAMTLHQDPLELAKTYDQWRKRNWITIRKDVGNQMPGVDHLPAACRPVILSVDDSAIVQVTIKRAIGDRYTVICASSAIEALNILNANPIELMLLDVTMPEIDGLELCRTIRKISRFKDLPVVMLTAKDGLIDKVKGQFAGSTHYLAKPVNRETLLPVLEKYLAVAEVVF